MFRNGIFMNEDVICFIFHEGSADVPDAVVFTFCSTPGVFDFVVKFSVLVSGGPEDMHTVVVSIFPVIEC